MEKINFETGEVTRIRRFSYEESISYRKIPNGNFVMLYVDSLKAFVNECIHKNVHFAECLLLLFCLAHMNTRNEIMLHYTEAIEKLGMSVSSFSKARKNLEKMRILTQKNTGRYIVNCASLTVNGRFAASRAMEFHDFERFPALCNLEGNVLPIGIEPAIQKMKQLEKKAEEMKTFGETLDSAGERSA